MRKKVEVVVAYFLACLFAIAFLYFTGEHIEKINKERRECERRGGVFVEQLQPPYICIKEIK